MTKGEDVKTSVGLQLKTASKLRWQTECAGSARAFIFEKRESVKLNVCFARFFCLIEAGGGLLLNIILQIFVCKIGLSDWGAAGRQSPKRGCNALKVGFFVPLWFENILR